MKQGGLPFSKAPGSVWDDRLTGEEDRASRAREVPARDNWYLSPLPIGSAVGDKTGLTANLLRLYYLGKLTSGTGLHQARLNITTASAGQTVRSALFIYDKAQTGRRLMKVPESEAMFLATSTGVQSIALPFGTEVSAGQFFLGVKASDNVLGVGGVAGAAVSRVVPVYTYAAGAGVLPPVLDFSSLTKDYTTTILDVVYINPDAAQVL